MFSLPTLLLLIEGKLIPFRKSILVIKEKYFNIYINSPQNLLDIKIQHSLY